MASLLRAMPLLGALALMLAFLQPRMAAAAEVPFYVNDQNAADNGIKIASGTLGNLLSIQPDPDPKNPLTSATVFFNIYQTSPVTAAGLSFKQPVQGAGFNGMTVYPRTVALALGSAGLDIPYGIQVTPSSPTDLIIKLAQAQTWNLSAAFQTTADGIHYMNAASLGAATQTVRIDSLDSVKKTLTLNVNGIGDDGYGYIGVSEAFLDPGPNIDLVKRGDGNLTLGVYDSGSTLPVFNGTLTVSSGTVTLQNGFLKASGNSRVGPALTFYAFSQTPGGRAIGYVQVVGSNAVAGLSGASGVVTSAPAASGTLIVGVAAGGVVTASNAFKDSDSLNAHLLALRKVGQGVLEMQPSPYLEQLDLSSNYSGGTFLEEGVLRLSDNSKTIAGTLSSGPLGVGALRFLGGTLRVGSASGSVTFSNNVHFGAAIDPMSPAIAKQSRAVIDGAGTLYIQSARLESISFNAERDLQTAVYFNADTVLRVDTPVVIHSDIVSNAADFGFPTFKLIKDGASVLTLQQQEPANRSGPDITLRDGTLDLASNHLAQGTHFTIDSDRIGTKRTLRSSSGFYSQNEGAFPTQLNGISTIALHADFSYRNAQETPRLLDLSIADSNTRALSQTVLGGGEFAYGMAVPGRVTISVDHGTLILGDVASNPQRSTSRGDWLAFAGTGGFVVAGTEFAAGMLLSGSGVNGRRVMSATTTMISGTGFIVAGSSSLVVAGSSQFVPGTLLRDTPNPLVVRSVSDLRTDTVVLYAGSHTVSVADAKGIHPGMSLSNNDLNQTSSVLVVAVSGSLLTLSDEFNIADGAPVTAAGSLLGLSGTLTGSGLESQLTGTYTSLVLDGAAIDHGTYALGGTLSPTYLGKAGPGTLQFAGKVDLPGMDISAGSILFSSPAPVNFAGTLTVSGTAAFNVQGGTVHFSGPINGNGFFIKEGRGQLVIGRSNPAFRSSILLADGTLSMGAGMALGPSPVIILGSSHVRLQLNGNDMLATVIPQSASEATAILENSGTKDATLTVNGALTFNGKLQDGGAGKLSLVKVGGGSLLLTGTSNTYSGTTTVAGGTLYAGVVNLGGANTANPSPLVITESGHALLTSAGGSLGAVLNSGTTGGRDASLVFSGTSGVMTLASLSGLGRTIFRRDATISSGSISAGSVEVEGILSASISGGLINTGTLNAQVISGGSVTVLGPAVITRLSGGSLHLNGPAASVTKLYGGTIVLGTEAVLSAFEGSTAGVISGAGALVKSGPGQLTFSNTNTYQGTTTIHQGSLAFAGNGAVVGAITNDADATLYFDSVTPRTFSGTLRGTGALLKKNTNTITLSSASGFSGPTTIDSGTVEFAHGVGSTSITLAGTGAGVAFHSGSYTFNGSVAGIGTAYLSGTASSPLILSLGIASTLGAKIQIGRYATLTLGADKDFAGEITVDGGTLIFDRPFNNSSASLAIKAGMVDLHGYSQNLKSLSLAGGSLWSSGAYATIKADNILGGTFGSLGATTGTRVDNAGAIQETKVEFTDGTHEGLRLTAGALQFLASGTLGNGGVSMLVGGTLATVSGSYAFVETRAAQTNKTLYFDQAVIATGSVVAAANSGAAYTLVVQAPIKAPFMTVQSGVTAMLSKHGSFASGTLQLEGGWHLTGSVLHTFETVLFRGGTLSGEPLSPVSIGVLIGDSGVLSAPLAGIGSIVKTTLGSLVISASGGTLGTVSNANRSADSLLFSATAGTISIGSLLGLGSTRFSSNATISAGSIHEGTVQVDGLLNASITGGRVVAGSLRANTLSGGFVSVTGTATLESMSGGTLALHGRSSSITSSLSGGEIILGGANAMSCQLTVYSGASSGLISGTGTLVKSGADSLSLGPSLGSNVALRIDGGTLNALNLLTGTRSISVGEGSMLGLKLDAGTVAFNGMLRVDLGSLVLTGSSLGSHLQIRSSDAVLDGNVDVGNHVTLDVSKPAANIFGERAKLSLRGGASLLVGGPEQELRLQELNINGSGMVNISGTGGKILVDILPSFLDENFQVVSGSVSVAGVSFDYDSKGGPLIDHPGVYRFVAGAVRNKTSTGAPEGILAGSTLLLEPQTAKSVISLGRPVLFSAAIIAGGSDGYGTISLGTLAYTPLLRINAGATVSFENLGQLQISPENPGASHILNSGTLVAVGSTGFKEIPNLISGTGALTKTGSGMLRFTGDNAQFDGAIHLEGGTFVAGSKTSLGRGSIHFNGGSLRFDSGLGDLSFVGAVFLQAQAGGAVDTGPNNVSFTGNVSGPETLLKMGSGTLVLEGNNAGLTGRISVTEGALQIGAGGTGGDISSSSGITVADKTIMRLARAENTDLRQTIAGAGTLVQGGSGTTILSGDNLNFTGAIVLSEGTLQVNSPQAMGGSAAAKIFFKGGVLQYGPSNNTDYSNRFTALDGEQIKVNTNGQDVKFATAISGNRTSLLKSGPGELVLSDKGNRYSGVTTVEAGTLRLLGAQQGASPIVLNSGQLVYEVSGGAISGVVSMASDTRAVFSVGPGSSIFQGSLSGAGAVIKQGPGSLTATHSMLHTGGFTLNGGTLELLTLPGASSKTSMGGAIVLNAGTLDVSTGILNLDSTLKAGAQATVKLGADTLFLKSVDLTALKIQLPEGVASLTVFTDLEPTLTSSHSMLGGGSVLFKVYDPVSIRASDLHGEIDNKATMNSLLFDGTGKVSFRNSLALNGDLQTIPGSQISFARNITIAGAVQLYGGKVDVAGGTLYAMSSTVEVGRSAAPALLLLSGVQSAIATDNVRLSAGSIDVSSAALGQALQRVQTIEVGTSNGHAEAAQLILGGGTGSITLAAAQTLKGSGTIRGSVLLKDASSVLSPGNSPGKLTIAGAVNLLNGTLQIEVGKTMHDQIETQGRRVTIGSLATLLLVDYENGAFSAGGTLKDIFIGGTMNGSFSTDRIRLLRKAGDQSFYSAMFTAVGSVNDLRIVRSRFADTRGLSYNAKGYAAALDSRIIVSKAINESLLEMGTGSSPEEAAARVPLQLAAGNPAGYAEMAGLSKQRLLTLNQSLVNHFASLRAGRIEAVEPEYNLWTTSYGTWHRQNSNPFFGDAGFSANTYGELFGVEKRAGNLLVGFIGAVGSSSATFHSLAGRVSTDSWHSGAYATTSAGGYTLEAGLLFGRTDSTAHRVISAAGMNQGIARDGKLEFGGSEWLAHVGVAQAFQVSGSFTLTPSIRIVAQGNVLAGASENNLDGLELKTQKQRTSSVLHELGVEVRKSLTVASKPAALSFQMDWVHDYAQSGRVLAMDIAGDPSTRFGYRGSDAGADGFRLGGGLEAVLTRRTTFRISLDYQIQSKAAAARGSFSLGYSF